MCRYMCKFATTDYLIGMPVRTTNKYWPYGVINGIHDLGYGLYNMFSPQHGTGGFTEDDFIGPYFVRVRAHFKHP